MSVKAPAAVMFAAAGGGSISTPLTVLFVILKLTGVIAWSWLWVLSPLIVAIGLCVVFIIGFIILALVVLDE